MQSCAINYRWNVNNINFNSSATGGRGYNKVPELEPNSGHILYVENRKLISRASVQTEDIKIVIGILKNGKNQS